MALNPNNPLIPNNKPLKGILNEEQSAKHYTLERYFPSIALSEFIEQYWCVNWDLTKGQTHTQHNLPEPSFHLTIGGNQVKVLAPVTRDYKYTMSGKGSIFGIKFLPGVIPAWLNVSADTLVDQKLLVEDVFKLKSDTILSTTENKKSNEKKAKNIEVLFIELLSSDNNAYTISSPELKRAQGILECIKDSNIVSVEQLSLELDIPIRSIQRSLKMHIGFSPKWLIRKYRIHQALNELDLQQHSLATLAASLGYTDQSHFSRDFMYFTGQSPTHYRRSMK